MTPPEPVRVDVSALLRRPGSRRRVEHPVDLGPIETSVAAVTGEVALNVELEAQGEQIIVTGTVAVTWSGACRRCLEPVVGREQVALHEVFERRPVEGETYPFVGHEIDLTTMAREAVLLALPLAPLCRPDCAGPDPDRFRPAGPTAADGPAPTGDPRWAALDELRFD